MTPAAGTLRAWHVSPVQSQCVQNIQNLSIQLLNITLFSVFLCPLLPCYYQFSTGNLLEGRVLLDKEDQVERFDLKMIFISSKSVGFRHWAMHRQGRCSWVAMGSPAATRPGLPWKLRPFSKTGLHWKEWMWLAGD